MATVQKKWLVRVLAVSLLVYFGLAGIPSQAKAEYPEDQIRYILHVKPGGATDVLARKLAAGLQKELGVTIVVENRPGGESAKQLAVLTRSDPDGYTIGSVTASHIASFHSTLKRYNIESVDWVCGVVVDPYLIAVQANSPFNTLKEMVAYIKKNPGQVKVAGFANGSGGHIAWEIFAQAAGITDEEIKWIPYNSVNEAVTSVLGAHSDITVSYVGLVHQYVTTGRLKVLGIMADEPPELMPDIPTFKEAGFDVDTGWEQFRGIIAPKGMPDDRKIILANAVEKVMAQPDFKKYLHDAQLNYGYMPPDKFDKFVRKMDKSTQSWLEKLGMTK